MAQCGSTKDLLQLVREQLKDVCSQQRYSDSFLLSRLNLALLNVYAYRPEAFGQEIIQHKLQAGKNQKLPSGAVLLEFVGTSFKDGTEYVSCETKPSQASDDFLAAYDGRCAKKPATASVGTQAKCDEFTITSFSYEKKNGEHFSISPAAPAGKEVYATLLVSSCPQCSLDSLDDEIPCKWYAAMYEKLMAIVYEVESEDPSNSEKAKTHSLAFEKIMGVTYKQDSRISSGYYLGQRPDGSSDSQVVRG